MRKELDYGDLFVRWGKPGEKLDDDWRVGLRETIAVEGRVVAYNENNAVLAGSSGVWLFRGVYIAWDGADTLLGPYKSFNEAAKAAEVFSVADITQKIWVDPRVILNSKLPLRSSGSTSRLSHRAQTKSAKRKLVMDWEKAAKDFTKKMCSSGHAVRVTIGQRRFSATFVRSSSLAAS